MIEIGLSGFFLTLFLVVVVLAGLGSAWDRLHERRAARAVRRNTVRCRTCGAAYRREVGLAIQACPDCGSRNTVGRDRRLG